MAARFLKINKILKSKLMTAPSYIIIFNFSFPFSIGRGIKSLDDGQGPFVKFRRVASNCPPVDPKIFSEKEDLKCLVLFSQGIAEGKIPDFLKDKRAVRIHGARWRNHFTRILSLYCR